MPVLDHIHHNRTSQARYPLQAGGCPSVQLVCGLGEPLGRLQAGPSHMLATVAARCLAAKVQGRRGPRWLFYRWPEVVSSAGSAGVVVSPGPGVIHE